MLSASTARQLRHLRLGVGARRIEPVEIGVAVEKIGSAKKQIAVPVRFDGRSTGRLRVFKDGRERLASVNALRQPPLLGGVVGVGFSDVRDENPVSSADDFLVVTLESAVGNRVVVQK